jgi:hypothetical protein
VGGAFVPADYPGPVTLNLREGLEFREGGGELVVVLGERFVRHRVTIEPDRTERPRALPALGIPVGRRGAPSARGPRSSARPPRLGPRAAPTFRNLVDHANTHEKQMRRLF